MRRFHPKEFFKLTRFEYAEILKIFLMGKGSEIDLPPDGEIKLLTDDVLSELLTGTEEENRKTIERYEKVMKSVVLNIYKDRLEGERKNFPHNFFKGYQGRLHLKWIIRYVIEEILKIPIERIPKEVSRTFMNNYKLSNPIGTKTANFYEAINIAYPDRFRPWEFQAPVGYWRGEKGLRHAREATRWLIEERLKMNLSDIKNRVNVNIERFKENGLISMVLICYKGSWKKAILDAYSERLKCWELPRVPNGYWVGEKGLEHAKEATRWLIEERLKIPVKEIPKKVSQMTFAENGLRGMLSKCFRGSSYYMAIQQAYPGMFKPWEFKRGKYWDDKGRPKGAKEVSKWGGKEGIEKAREATRWLIEEKLKIPIEQIPKVISTQHFHQNGLRGLLYRFDNSIYKTIENAYPGKFNRWKFRGNHSKWQGEEGLKNAREATRWLLEEKLKIDIDKIPSILSQRDFHQNGLGGMLYCRFNRSIYLAVDNLYPNRFKPWEFKRTYKWKGKDSLKTVKEATRYLIEEVLRLDIDEIPDKITQKNFLDYGLGGMLAACFKGSYHKAILHAYPGRFKIEKRRLVSLKRRETKEPRNRKT